MLEEMKFEYRIAPKFNGVKLGEVEGWLYNRVEITLGAVNKILVIQRCVLANSMLLPHVLLLDG